MSEKMFFRCQKCGHAWTLHRMAERCPACGEERAIQYHRENWGPVPWKEASPVIEHKCVDCGHVTRAAKAPLACEGCAAKREAKRVIDKAVRSDYYGGPDNPYEAIKVFEAWYGPAIYRAWLKITVVKYLIRVGQKAGEDEEKELKKAHFYLGEMLASLKREREKQMAARREVLEALEKEGA